MTQSRERRANPQIMAAVHLGIQLLSAAERLSSTNFIFHRASRQARSFGRCRIETPKRESCMHLRIALTSPRVRIRALHGLGLP